MLRVLLMDEVEKNAGSGSRTVIKLIRGMLTEAA
jgi:hypothetical protein